MKIELVWNHFSSYINGFFFDRHMERYLKIAAKMKILVDEYLVNHSYKFTSEICSEPEPDWPKVSIDVKVSVATYGLVLKVWEEVGGYVYPQFKIEDLKGVFLSFDLLD